MSDDVTITRDMLGDWARMVASFEKFLTNDSARDAAHNLAMEIALLAVAQ